MTMNPGDLNQTLYFNTASLEICSNINNFFLRNKDSDYNNSPYPKIHYEILKSNNLTHSELFRIIIQSMLRHLTVDEIENGITGRWWTPHISHKNALIFNQLIKDENVDNHIYNLFFEEFRDLGINWVTVFDNLNLKITSKMKQYINELFKEDDKKHNFIFSRIKYIDNEYDYKLAVYILIVFYITRGSFLYHQILKT